MTQAAQELESHLQAQLGSGLFGMEEVVHALAVAVLARGHVLLEGPPGLGKTRISKAFARGLGGSFRRVQGTADLMPSDVTGVHVYDSAAGEFSFKPGPLFADVLLVDEINRAGPKTQSALLEAMEERQVTADRDTFSLAEDFMLIATRNPREFEGTFPMPESQLDRFALCVNMGYADRNTEMEVLRRYSLPESAGPGDGVEPIPEGLVDGARAELSAVEVSEELLNYVLDLAAATRDSASVSLGLSARGALMLTRCARIEAALRGGSYVLPDDVQRVAPWVVPHRLGLNAEAAISGIDARKVLERVLADVAVPK